MVTISSNPVNAHKNFWLHLLHKLHWLGGWTSRRDTAEGYRTTRCNGRCPCGQVWQPSGQSVVLPQWQTESWWVVVTRNAERGESRVDRVMFNSKSISGGVEQVILTISTQKQWAISKISLCCFKLRYTGF